MTDLIHIKNTSYARYEELLLRKEEIKKKAFQYQQEYIREFGELIVELLQQKLECIRLKKTMAFCQASLNRGSAVDQKTLQDYLQAELAAFQEQLNQMVEEKEAADKADSITEYDLLTIKKVYRRLVKLLHPDINPLVAESETLQELWNRILIAYNCNQLKDLQELELLAHKALEEVTQDSLEIYIPDIHEKIQQLEEEIEKIRSTDPYQYKYLLTDEGLVKEKKASLREEIKSYREYAAQLEEMLSQLFLDSGGSFSWHLT